MTPRQHASTLATCQGIFREWEVEDIFAPHGRIRSSIDIKVSRESAFAFIDTADECSADKACYHEHGRWFDGDRLWVHSLKLPCQLSSAVLKHDDVDVDAGSGMH